MLALYLGMIETPEEKTAFEDLYNKYRGKMFSLAYSILKNYHNAEEAVSQAFFTIARNFSKIRDLSPVKQGAYLKITVKNAAIDIYRKETGENSTPIEEIEDFTAAPDDVSDEVLSEMNYNKIVEAIRSLPEQYGECLYLFHVRELSIKEIAAHLYIEPEAVKKRLQRARQKLRKILEENEITI
ncbi:MAG: sigma-70 family RNA polymerase sigma factor [Ruminiclostridium sp.]|nr:sigma-70 family RNA polymerase sigma factor [Ruminiclostridium sp.]